MHKSKTRRRFASIKESDLGILAQEIEGDWSESDSMEDNDDDSD